MNAVNTVKPCPDGSHATILIFCTPSTLVVSCDASIWMPLATYCSATSTACGMTPVLRLFSGRGWLSTQHKSWRTDDCHRLLFPLQLTGPHNPAHFVRLLLDQGVDSHGIAVRKAEGLLVSVGSVAIDGVGIRQLVR